MPNLKKALVFNIADEEIIVNVDWSLLEKVERVYNMRAETVAFNLQSIQFVRRSHIAEIVALFVQGLTKLKQSDVKEFVFTCPQKQMDLLIGKVQAAILWSIRGDDGNPLINDEQFDCLAEGKDLPATEATAAPTKAKEDSAKPKKQRAATSKKLSD